MAEKKKRHWLSRLSFGSVSLFMSALLLLSYVSVVIDPAKAWFFTLFGLLYPVVFPIVLVLFVWSLFRRSRMRVLLAVALLPSIFFAGRFYQIDRPSDLPEPTLKVVSYNVGLFAHSASDTPRMVLADSVSRYLRALDADIICLQEFWLPLSEQPEEWLRRHFPGYKAEYYVFTGKSGRFGNVTLSRRGFEGKGKETFEKSTNLAIYTDVRLDSSVLRLYNCHFESYNISLPALVKNDEGIVEETERKMSRAISERPKQVARVLRGPGGFQRHPAVIYLHQTHPRQARRLHRRRQGLGRHPPQPLAAAEDRLHPLSIGNKGSKLHHRQGPVLGPLPRNNKFL